MTLLDALVRAAAGLDGVTASRLGPVIEWSVEGHAFARADARRAEFRLKPLVGHAALGTPDTDPSPLGSDWVAFRPRELDRFALDRAAAWFASAATTAASRGFGPPLA